MKFVIDPLLGILCTIFGLLIHPVVALAIALASAHFSQPWLLLALAPCLLGIVAVLFAKRDAAPGADGVLRSDLPGWAWPWRTPDERAPGDVLEPTVRSIYSHFGPLVCSLYWHIWRNPGLGLAFFFGRRLDDGEYLNGELWGAQHLSNGAWRQAHKLGPFQICWGNQTTVNKLDGQLYAIPWATFKTVHNGKP